ncbi:MAG: HAD family hydrolase [Elusimicrobiaceae bacterium]
MKALLFDHGGTLDSNGVAWKEQFLPIYRGCGIDVAAEKFDRAFYDADDNLPSRHDLKNLSLEQTVSLQVADVLANLGIQNPLPKQDAITFAFLDNCRNFFRKNIPVLERLAKDFRLGIVSNNYGNLASMLESEGLLKYFGSVADSGVVGATKPDPKIFQAALDELGVSAQDAIMVGDSVKRDIAGAVTIGMSAALLWGDRFRHSAPPELRGNVIILKNFTELPDRLPALSDTAGSIAI